MQNTSFNEVRPHSHFSPWHLFVTKRFHFFDKNCNEDKILPEKKHNACRKTLCEQRQDTLNEIEPHHFFLHNMCLKKGRIPLLKHDVYLALLFQPFGRHTAYMQPYLFPKIKIDVYFAFFHLIAKVFNELVRNLVKVHRKLCTYRHQHMFSGKPFSCRTCTQRFPFLHIVALLPLLLWRSFAQLSL